MQCPDGLEIKIVTDDQSFERITDILHADYAQLAALGFNYMAVDQPVEVTRERAKDGECYAVGKDGNIVGTVTFLPPSSGKYHPHYERSDVAVFGQFAVDPQLQRSGIGKYIVAFLEQRARDLGARELACYTAEGATHLVEWYHRMGYVQVDKTDWPHATYTSLIFSKPL